MSLIGLVWDRVIGWRRQPKVELCSSKIDALWETCCARWSTCDETNNMKAQLYFVTHEMCRKREKEREREANNLFYFLPLNRFQLLFFNLERDILSFSYSHRTVINGTLVASKGTVIESTRTKCVNLNLLYLKNRLCCRKWERVNWSEQINKSNSSQSVWDQRVYSFNI